MVDQWFRCRVVVQDIRHATDCIKYKLLILLDATLVDRCADLLDQAARQLGHGSERGHRDIFFRAQIRQEFNHLRYGVFQIASRELLVLRVATLLLLGLLALLFAGSRRRFLTAIPLEVVYSELSDNQEARLLSC